MSVVEEMLADDNWSLQELLSRLKTFFVSFDKIADLQDAEYFFFNANTPEDYAKARQIEKTTIVILKRRLSDSL